MPNEVVVVGASGFGREVLDVLEAIRAAGEMVDVVGVVDDAPVESNLARLARRHVQYLGTVDTHLASTSSYQFVLGIGNPEIRQRLVRRFERAGRKAFTAIHPSASIGSDVRIGEGTVVCAGAVISTNVVLGQHVHINPNATVGHDAKIGEFVSINPGAVISGEVQIGRGVLVGAAATVLQELTVGDQTTIGASALVTKCVPSSVVVKGVPGGWGRRA